MPMLEFRLRWESGDETVHVSPSTIVRSYFEVGRQYPTTEFRDLARSALQAASERVRQTRGHLCSIARQELISIEQMLDERAQAESRITFIGYEK